VQRAAFLPAFGRAADAGRAAEIELRTDPDWLTTRGPVRRAARGVTACMTAAVAARSTGG
jgi:hypothetical protein